MHLGHNFPVWLKFKGGKGVATSLGVIVGMMPLAALIVFAIWGIVFKVSRYVSLASLVCRRRASRDRNWPDVRGADSRVVVLLFSPARPRCLSFGGTARTSNGWWPAPRNRFGTPKPAPSEEPPASLTHVTHYL
jgi:hypothetical protein